MKQVNLFKTVQSKKQIGFKKASNNDELLAKEVAEKKRLERIKLQTTPTTQGAIKYTSQFEEGLMHIVGDEYSQMFKLGEVDYEVSTDEEQSNVVIGYAEALNKLDKHSRYQLLVINRAVPENLIDQTLLPYQADKFDNYREEINEIIQQQYEKDERNFQVDKYAIFTTASHSRKQASKNLVTLASNYVTQFDDNEVDLSVEKISGLERLKVMASLLKPDDYFISTYEDIAVSGLSSKAFISPSKMSFPRGRVFFKLGEKYGAILYIKQYPKYLEDTLIREITSIGRESVISIHARPYDMKEAKKKVQAVSIRNETEIAKQQKRNFKAGVSEDMVSGEAKEIKESTESLRKQFKEDGQKLFSGIFTVMVLEDDEHSLKQAIQDVKDVGSYYDVYFETIEDYKTEALNTILPIGKPYLDVEMNYMRDMTSFNVATQIPFSNVELQHPTGHFYGTNQLTNNMITVDRKKGMIAPGGLIFGSSGSGKGMTTKWEIIGSKLRYPNDKTIIVDPESEYLELAKEFGAEILDISTGTSNHLNILDMADKSLLDEEDQSLDLVKEKANLLATLFESILKSFTDEDAAIVDRVTRKTYEQFEGQTRNPTLVDWHNILLNEPEDSARLLATKVEPYTIGAQDIFAHETNIDLNANFIVFNIKKLDARLKPFAMKVILDQIWKQVVDNQGKTTIHLYFDELQENFDTEENSLWFTSVWARIRKYGAIPTGITQNISTLLDSAAGRKMVSNSEYIVLLRQKPVDLLRLEEMIRLPPKLLKYVGNRVEPGTGLISAGGVIVPFENSIPKHTDLFRIMNTDA